MRLLHLTNIYIYIELSREIERKMSNCIIIIPARYQSSRFPGKPLAKIGDKTMIQHVYERCIACDFVQGVFVATDHEDIFDEVVKFGGMAVMTDIACENGTQRIAEACNFVEEKIMQFDYVINVQGDEPFIAKSQIETVYQLLMQENAQVATLVKEIKSTHELFSPHVVKVVMNNDKNGMYFSRSPIPFMRDVPEDIWAEEHTYFKHIGIYGFQKSVLKDITKLQATTLENAENLEQLRWLQNGYVIKLGLTDIATQAVDTPQDLEFILNNLPQ